MDNSLAYLVSRMLPLCNYYYHSSLFIEEHGRYEYGMTSHAFRYGFFISYCIISLLIIDVELVNNIDYLC